MARASAHLATPNASDLLEKARAAAASVVDPEIPVITIEELGVLRDVAVEADGSVTVTITPTYTGCPAMTVFVMDIEVALDEAGFEQVRVETVLSPAWTSDWMSEAAREKLRAYGIAPPVGSAGSTGLFDKPDVACPRCGSLKTERISEFGSTACKALYKCGSCHEPFDYFKCI
ncbi:phenylacetate-CoA oxygenase subunit PaaJ [Rhodobacteraceae bacterium RKSG542]|uniref:1,2-phenylacetyl-CoA epoxidase subunit PaaD n=1 Tax=Pseudovibrio flavus TaxID=2529854 RepID=UPI0012BBE5DC|nr:1,2-phenylacetyl-CoA epoxidase subunit PaaD [Pseudovibrio flavus]MTI16244.1 phenylacetate-CoA oxygenase subunit PaaJ [Pseudovibrio flavus]